jgi:hypothetical protein
MVQHTLPFGREDNLVHVCPAENKRRTKFKCPELNVGLCASQCFKVRHTELNFWGPADTKLEQWSSSVLLTLSFAHILSAKITQNFFYRNKNCNHMYRPCAISTASLGGHFSHDVIRALQAQRVKTANFLDWHNLMQWLCGIICQQTGLRTELYSVLMWCGAHL